MGLFRSEFNDYIPPYFWNGGFPEQHHVYTKPITHARQGH